MKYPKLSKVFSFSSQTKQKWNDHYELEEDWYHPQVIENYLEDVESNCGDLDLIIMTRCFEERFNKPRITKYERARNTIFKAMHDFFVLVYDDRVDKAMHEMRETLKDTV